VAFDVENDMMKAWGEDSEFATDATLDWNRERMRARRERESVDGALQTNMGSRLKLF